MTRGPSGAERIETYLGPAGAAYSIIKPIVEFLAHPLDEVTGDPDGLRDKAQAWTEAANNMRRLAENELAERSYLLSYWAGEAAEAFNSELAQINQSMHEIAEHFAGTADLLRQAADGAKEAQDLVEDIVKELIIWLIGTIIVALASSWITFGASVAAGAAAGAAESAVAAGRCATVAARLAKLLRSIQAFLKKMSQFAQMYKITNIGKVGPKAWAGARFATVAGGQFALTNAAIQQSMVKPIVKPTVNWAWDQF